MSESLRTIDATASMFDRVDRLASENEDLLARQSLLEDENRRLKDRIRLLEGDRQYAKLAVDMMSTQLAQLAKRTH